ncbi:hypothetical protein ABPG75_008386 [Micractinium tetrahymenae]
MPGEAVAPEYDLLRGNPKYERANKETGANLALKFIPRGPEHINKYVEREILNHIKLRHPHIIALREVFLTQTHLVLAMEHAVGGDLFKYVSSRRGLPEDEARWFFQQLMIAVDYCHRMGVSSRDIKLENALLDGSPRSLIKLADFGFSKDANDQSAPTSRVGTPAYLAPEVISNRMGQVYDGKKADVWSCGVLLYVMLLDRYPFRRPGDNAYGPNQKLNLMLQRILVADYAFPENKALSPGARDLISRILVPDPEQRLSLQHILAHPWFLEGLHPAALQFNDRLVEESRANQPSADVLTEARLIVQEAAKMSAAVAAQPGEQGVPERQAALSGEICDSLNSSLRGSLQEDGEDGEVVQQQAEERGSSVVTPLSMPPPPPG